MATTKKRKMSSITLWLSIATAAIAILSAIFSQIEKDKEKTEALAKEQELNQKNNEIIESQKKLLLLQKESKDSQAEYSNQIISLQNQLQEKQTSLQERTEKVVELQKENINYLKAENSFCLLDLHLVRERGEYYIYFRLSNIGKYPLRNVKIEVYNLTKQHARYDSMRAAMKLESDKYKVGDAIDMNAMEKLRFTMRDFKADYSFSPEIVWPVQTTISGSNRKTDGIIELSSEKFDEKDLHELICFNANFNLPNGESYVQRIKLRNPGWKKPSVLDNWWYYATEVFPNKSNFEHKEVRIGYLMEPQEKESDIDWSSITKW